MVRKKRSRRTSTGRRFLRRSSPKQKGILGQLKRPITGAFAYIGYEALISPMIPVNGVAKNVIELVGGAIAMRKGGIIGAAGQTAVTINAYQLARGLAAGQLGIGAAANGNPLEGY